MSDNAGSSSAFRAEELVRVRRAGSVATPELWRHLVRHSAEVRVYEQIWDDERVNAWLICWSEDQDTGFHDHDRSGAAITVVEGQIPRNGSGWDGAPRGHG